MSTRLNRTPLLVLVSALVLLWGLPGRASATISGNFGCLGNFVYSFLPSGSKAPQTLTFSQLMRLAISPSGGIVANIFYGVSGAEICHSSEVKGTISVDATGVGLLKLIFTAGIDEDSDFSCTNFFVGRTSITENFHIIATKGGSRLSFFGKDDFLTPSTKDNGDFILAAIGECLLQ